VPRRHLSEDEVLKIVLNKATTCDRPPLTTKRDLPDEAQRLRSLAKVADRYAAEWSKGLA